MSAYVYNVYTRNTDCPGCTGERSPVLATGKKWVATKYLTTVVESGESLMNYEVFRSRDGMRDTTVEVDVYEFMDMDLGEVL